jgi:hypothetical protein
MSQINRNFFPNSKVIIISLSSLIFIAFSFWFFLLPSLLEVIQENNQNTELINQAEFNFLEVKLYQEFLQQDGVSDLAPIKESQAQDFIAFLKEQAEKNNINLRLQEYYDIKVSGNNNMIPIAVQLSGGHSEITSYIDKIFNSNYLLNISSIELTPASSIDSDSNDNWQAKVVLNSYWIN